MWGRILVGLGSLGLYGWRVEDPKGSYGAFYDASEWLTSHFIADGGGWGYVRSFVNIILVDQADGFLLGMAFAALVSIVLWPVRRTLGWGGSRIVRAVGRGGSEPDGDRDERRGHGPRRGPVTEPGPAYIRLQGNAGRHPHRGRRS